jgi:tetratricopeptide (TPR) repeat protein
MTRFRLVLALTALFGLAGTVYSAPAQSPEAEAIEHLSAAFATHDPARITYAYRDMGQIALPAADIVESTVNAMGYELLESGDTIAAIKVFALNTGSFPQSANAWDSLAEANMTKGDHENAIRCYRVSLELNPDSSNAAQMIEKLMGEQQAAL